MAQKDIKVLMEREPFKSAQKSTRESSFLRRKVDYVYLCIYYVLHVGMTYIGLCQLYKGSKYQVLPHHPL